jgi:hypothetical protein
MKSGKALKASIYKLKKQFIKSVVEAGFKRITDESSANAKYTCNNSVRFPNYNQLSESQRKGKCSSFYNVLLVSRVL